MIKKIHETPWPLSTFVNTIFLLSALIYSGCSSDGNPTPNELPVISDQQFKVTEHSANGTTVGIIIATDADGDDLVFRIASVNDQDFFEIDQTTGELTVGNGEINFETRSSHQLDVSVSDGDKEQFAKIEIIVEDIDECEVGLCPTYLEVIYDENEINISNGLSYGSNTALKFDYYSVDINYDPKRPLVIVFPWSNLDNPKASVSALEGHCRDLARRGYAVALAYERESVVGETLKEDIIFYMRQVHDQKAAIRYFKKEAGTYGLDTMNFFVSGWSQGAVAALLTAQLELADLEQMIDGGVEFQEVYDEMGFEGIENLGYSSNINGVTMMTIFTSDLAIIDRDGPAMMIIHNQNTTLSDGTIVMGAFPYNNGVYSTTLYGPDMIKNHALNEGYIEGDNLGYILMNGGTNNPILSTLTSNNWYDIATFYHNNLNR